ncbi:MAG: hypothetical protein M1818_002500 [Claussenomyces sp. TS43310]|nr:MAG: hypothetical protein M1818_002500 [Claussenomyces sp. TS43310]
MALALVDAAAPEREAHRSDVASDSCKVRQETFLKGTRSVTFLICMCLLSLSPFCIQDAKGIQRSIWRGKRLVNAIEPANVQQVAALAFEDYGKDLRGSKAEAPFFDLSIFSDGLIQKHARAMAKPIFARAEMSNIDHLAAFASRFMELLPYDGSILDEQHLLYQLVECIFQSAERRITMLR